MWASFTGCLRAGSNLFVRPTFPHTTVFRDYKLADNTSECGIFQTPPKSCKGLGGLQSSFLRNFFELWYACP